LSKRPTCRSCGKPHFNFIECSAVEAFEAEQSEQARIQRNLADRRVMRPRTEGARDWSSHWGRGDYTQHANQVAVVRRQHPIHAQSRPDRPADAKPIAQEIAANLLGE